jgi:hypothetical protein
MSPTGTAPTGTKLVTCKDIVARAYRQFLYPIDRQTGKLHNWSFVKQLHVIQTSVGKWKYELPVDFSDFITEPVFDDDVLYQELRRLAPEQILKARAVSTSTSYPTTYALAPFVYDASTGTMYELWLDAAPDKSYSLKFFYRIDPFKPANDSDMLVGGIRAVEAILETCLAVGEKEVDEQPGVHTAESTRLIQELIQADVADTSDYLGNLATPRKGSVPWSSMVNVDQVYESEGGVG